MKTVVLLAAVVLLVGIVSPAGATDNLNGWQINGRGLVGGVPWICVTDWKTETRCGPSIDPPRGQEWALGYRARCWVSRNECQLDPGVNGAEVASILFQYAPSSMYLPPPPVYVNPGIEAERGMLNGLYPPQPPEIHCESQLRGRQAWTTCR